MFKRGFGFLLAGVAVAALSVTAYADTPARGDGFANRSSGFGAVRREASSRSWGRSAWNDDDDGWNEDRGGRGGRRWFWNWGGSDERLLEKFKQQRAKEKQETVLSPQALAAPMVALGATHLKLDDAAADPLAATLYGALKSPGSESIRVREDFAEPIISFYDRRGFQPLWVDENGLTVRGRRLLDLFQSAGTEGLRRDHYLPASLNDFASDGSAFAGDRVALARLELEFTRSALDYARHVSTGRVDPSKISINIDIHPEAPSPHYVLARMASSVRPDEELRELAPQTKEYKKLKALLAKYRGIEQGGGWTEVPHIGKLKAGLRHASVPALRARLIESGDYVLTAPPAAGEEPEAKALLKSLAALTAKKAPEAGERLEAHGDDGGDIINVDDGDAAGEEIAAPQAGSTLYDDALVEAVKSFQERHGLAVDGVVGPNTIRMLNVPVSRKIEQIVLNMERRRWLPDDLGETHVFVNKSEFMMRMVNKGEVIHSAKVIIGKAQHQTAEFHNKIQFVVFNPYWNVPYSIKTLEMLPNLLRNGSYLSDNGYEVRDRRGRVVHSGDVDWSEAAEQGFPYDVRQLPSRSNALGTVKFLFPNKHAIYMHDTPTQPLFSRVIRTFSHGCVRVHRAQEFAHVLLQREGWSPEDIDAAFRSGKNNKVTLDRKIPVYLAYHTTWIDEDGRAQFRNDVYSRDERVRTALGQVMLAMK